MIINKTELDGVVEIIPKRFEDARGYFSETYAEHTFADNEVQFHWVQDNHSFSKDRFVLRGLHFQTPPFAQDKLVRVIVGEVFDVAVDIRNGSPTFGHWIGRTLSADIGNQLLIPKGFAHGFLTLTPGVHVVYKVTDRYAPETDRSICYDDPEIGIDWPLQGELPHLSAKDADAPGLSDVETGFEYTSSGP